MASPVEDDRDSWAALKPMSHCLVEHR